MGDAGIVHQGVEIAVALLNHLSETRDARSRGGVQFNRADLKPLRPQRVADRLALAKVTASEQHMRALPG